MASLNMAKLDCNLAGVSLKAGLRTGIATLVECEGPEASDWEHTYAACDVCEGTGRASA
jgi:hypothetical protein